MKTKYNWKKIQKFCDIKPRTWNEIRETFGISYQGISDAMKRGVLFFHSKYKDRCTKEYDWNKIQKDMTDGMTWREVSSEYGCSMPSMLKAKRRGDIKTLNISQAMVVSNKKHPRKHTQKTKDKISRIRKAYLKKHPDQVPYLLNHYSKGDSYPEKYFTILFRKEGIKLKKKYQVGLYQLDFADVKRKFDIEIDGSQHVCDQRIVKHDIERTKNLNKKGWKVYRILWSNYQKKTFEEKQKVIKKLKRFLCQ